MKATTTTTTTSVTATENKIPNVKNSVERKLTITQKLEI